LITVSLRDSDGVFRRLNTLGVGERRHWMINAFMASTKLEIICEQMSFRDIVFWFLVEDVLEGSDGSLLIV
jgi:hypothetical protein